MSLYSRLNAKENRCFHCSGAGHSKKDCPHLTFKKEPDTEDAKKPAKVTGKGKPSSPEKGSAETVVSSPEVPRGEKVVDKDSVMGLVGDGAGEKQATEAFGLLDGGATHPLRTARPGELDHAVQVNVELAHGSVTLHPDERTGTLLSAEPCEPIAPVRGLIDLGYKLTWSRSGCVIEHPRRGRIASHLRDGCPAVKEEDALALIEEIEAVELKKYMDVLKEGDVDAELMDWWCAHFPQVQPRIFRFMVRAPESTGILVPHVLGLHVHHRSVVDRPTQH